MSYCENADSPNLRLLRTSLTLAAEFEKQII